MTPSRILIVDDELAVRDSMQRWLQMDGYEVVAAEDAAAALRRLEQESFDLLLVDIRMPGMTGVELQHRLHELRPELPVVIVTAYASVDTAVEVFKRGAVDYLKKPVDPDELSRLVKRTLERSAQSPQSPSEAGPEAVVARSIVGTTALIQRVRERVLRAASCDSPVLLEGEPGTGHRLIAKTIHEASQRRMFALIPIDAAGLNDDALTDELFGTLAPAAAVGALRRRGKLELSNGGTLFVRNSEHLGLRGQAQLLELIEQRAATNPRDGQRMAIDARTIFGSMPGIETHVAEGTFSQELFHRINVIRIALPPLRERVEDITTLASRTLERLREESGHDFEGFAADAIAALEGHPWPGNVTQLVALIERAVAVGDPPKVRARDLELDTDTAGV
jgi:DNA-binding NtrC family response regulator